MKHAFLILAHNNWWQLKKLIHQLDDEHNDVYVHIDKKTTDFPCSDFEKITSMSKLTIVQEVNVYWGGYSQVEAELLLLELAKPGDYDYYHIISGADIPLKRNSEIHSFFEENAGKEFINFSEGKIETLSEVGRRTRLYHFLQNYRRRYRHQWINNCFIFLERMLLLIQLILGVNRTKKLDWTIKYGSQWVSITNELVESVLANKEKIEQIFRLTNCADELFIQTIAFNCGFWDKVYRSPVNEPGNLRLIDWTRGKNGSPYTFRISDFEMLTSSNSFFARKFSETTDREVIIQLYEWLGNKEGK